MSRPIDCTIGTVTPEDSSSEGCPILTKRRIVSIDKGQTARVCWPLRWRDGEVADLSDCFPSDSVSASSSDSSSAAGTMSVFVRFRDACGQPGDFPEVEAEVVDAANGQVCFVVPPEVADLAGVYGFQIAVFQDDEMIFSDTGIINVEQGLWGDPNQMLGPPTLEEIRFHMRDRAVENTLLRQVEFDDSELLMAIARPVQQFNETPPPLCHFTCRNFPYKYHWLNAIASELLRVSAHHYMRNALKTQSGGLNIDDKNKYEEYLAYAKLYIDEWRTFIIEKKVQLNAAGWSGITGSSYGNAYYGY